MGEKYPILKPREVISVLEKKGFYYKSKKGSHAKKLKEMRVIARIGHGRPAYYVFELKYMCIIVMIRVPLVQ
jgi:hypothetical protein